ncbi:MAG: class I SAM-dependent methyltransferase [Pseudomonadota bacterium]|nr:class I SAM-dependent methyltransferase [Pseudomonadota bacterium]
MPKTEPFEQHADLYDAWFDHHQDIYEVELKAIGRFIHDGQGQGLEVGVGSGKFALPLGIKTGVDPAAVMLKKAAAAGIKVFRGVAELLPFADQSFDFVLMVTTICFVDDLVQSFREAFRVLKNSGFIVVAFVDKNSNLGRQYQQRKENSKFYREAEFFSPPEVLTALETAGFRKFEVVQTLLDSETTAEIENGYGKGAFVVIKGMK